MSIAVTERGPSVVHQPGEELSHKQILEVMTGLLAALFTALISSTIVSTALPTIMSDLHGTQRQYTWVITASLLAMTITTPIWGKLSDLFNKKLLIQISIVLFVLGSIGAGFAQEIWQMMAGRAVQGVAMGGLTALVQAVMGTVIAPRQRGRYSGYMGAVMAVATVSGPLLGGVITDGLSWRWCFYVCIPFAVIALILLQITLKLPALPKRKVKIDYVGAFLLAVAAAAPMLWVTFAGKDFDWISWQSAAFGGVFLVTAGLAILVELKVAEPVVPIRVLKNRTTAMMIVASVAVGVAMFGAATFLTQYFQLAGGNSPTKAGLMTIPMIATQMLSAVIGGQIVSRTGRWKPVMIFGALMMLVGLGGLGMTDHTTDYWRVAIFMAVMGLGVGPLIQNIVLAVQNTVDVKDVGASSATISFFRSVGGAVGVSVLGAVLADQVEDKIVTGVQSLGGGAAGGSGLASGGDLDIKDLPGPVQQIVHIAYGDSFGHLFLIAAAVAIVTLLAVAFVREVPLRTTVSMRATEDPATPAHATPAHVTAAATTAVQATANPADTANVATAPQSQVAAAAPSGPTSSDDERPDHTPPSFDDPAERLSVSALDVLTAAQDRARAQDRAAQEKLRATIARIDRLSHDVDAAVGAFHRELQAIRDQLQPSVAQPPTPDGTGGGQLRRYEYNLLLDTQKSVDRLTRMARVEADRTVSEAEQRRSAIEKRIEQLRAVERELADDVAERLRNSRISASVENHANGEGRADGRHRND